MYDPEFTGFTTVQVANDLQVNIQVSLVIHDVVNFDSDIKDFVVGNGKLYVITDHRLHQMRHDLYEEKRKDITEHNRVNILVPFDLNSTLITCGTFNDGYCEVLDINDITNSIYYESYILIGPRQDEKSVAFITGTSSNRYLLVGKKDDDAKPQDTSYSVVSLWNTLQSQAGGIFSRIAEGSDAMIQSTVRDVEFVDGFQRVSPSESYLFLNTKTDSERKVLVLWMNSSKGKKREIIKSLQAATIRCCSDKARPVLVACTVIPSVNGVIWAGVFSAQNQQDPENSALALYDISNVKGRVKGFCAFGEKPCGSELVLDEKFTPGCPTVLFKSDDERAVFPRMHFDPVDFKHIYIALRKQLRRVSVVLCAKYITLKDCRAALDPLCGWCVNIQSGGRKIHVQGSNLELVESVTVFPSNEVLKTQYDTSSGDVWFLSHRYDGSGQFSLKLNVGNSTVDCVDYLSYQPDPKFIRFTTFPVANDLQVNIQKKADMLNLSMSEVTVMGLQGDQQYPCVLERVESNAIICTIKGESGAVPAVDSLTIGIGDTIVLRMGESTNYFCISP
ncbi:hypothetical protein cypCar_00046331 [Cyprinus carpio]|nr:hypothetical protein cypCar_00046331 [Cyprinus carpio]